MKISDAPKKSTLVGSDSLPLGAANSSQAFRTDMAQVKEFVNEGLTKAQVGLGNVDNTPDSQKNVATALALSTTGVANTACYESRRTYSNVDGVSEIKSIEGKSVKVWQKISTPFFNASIGNWNKGTVANGVLSYTTTSTYDRISISVNPEVGHKVLFVACYKANGEGGFLFSNNGDQSLGSTSISGTFTNNSIVLSVVKGGDNTYISWYMSETNKTMYLKYAILFDLTTMDMADCTTANEVAQKFGYSTWADFSASEHFEKLMQYSENPRLVSAKPIAKVNTGINLWDGKYTDTSYITTDGSVSSDSNCAVTDFIKVTASEYYYFKNILSLYYHYSVFWYDSNRSYISGSSVGAGDNEVASGVAQAPSNATFVRVVLFRNKMSDICINVSNTTINGNYYPYEESVLDMPRDLDNDLVELRKINDTVKDVAYKSGNKWKASRKIGIKVFDGTENWSSYLGGFNFRITQTKGARTTAHLINLPYRLSNNYDSLNNGEYIFTGYEVGDGNTSSLIIKDSTYTSFDTWKAHLAELYANGTPVVLYYELDTPYEEELIMGNSSQKCIGLGTETVKFEGIAPTIVATYNSGQGAKLNSLPYGNEIYTKDEADRTFFKVGGVHDYVDLGLPSGTLWARCNLGASNETEAGDYYAWGATEPYRVGIDNTSSYSGSYASTIDHDLTVGEDAAAQKLGVSWRMPTKAQFEELIANTTSTWTSIGGVNGRKFTASNGKWIFLPASGWYLNSQAQGIDVKQGCYLIRTYCSSSNEYYYYNKESSPNISNTSRACGCSIRPVLNPNFK